MRFLGLYNYGLKINNQSLAHIFPLTCVLHLVPRAVSLPSIPDTASAARIGEERFALNLKVLFFPWFDLPGILYRAFFSLFLCKERAKWGALVADEVERALRLAGFITFGRCMV